MKTLAKPGAGIRSPQYGAFASFQGTPSRTVSDTAMPFTLDGSSSWKDAFRSLGNDLAAPFTNPVPAHQGTLGVVSQWLGGALAVVQAPAALLDTGFALLTADLAEAWPAFPAVKIGLGFHLGPPHGHVHPPWGPLPTLGPVLLPGAINVLINGLPAARAGDVGVAITCGSLFPPVEIVLGSSKVFIGGSRAARMLDGTRQDNPVEGAGLSKLQTLQKWAGRAAGALGVATQSMDAEQSLAEADKAAAGARQSLARAEELDRMAVGADSEQAAAAAAAEARMQAAEFEAQAEAQVANAQGQSLGAVLSAAQMAADAAADALRIPIGKDPGVGPGTGNLVASSFDVLIGGFPCPNLWEKLKKGLLKAALGLSRKPRPTKDKSRETSPSSCPEN